MIKFWFSGVPADDLKLSIAVELERAESSISWAIVCQDSPLFTERSILYLMPFGNSESKAPMQESLTDHLTGRVWTRRYLADLTGEEMVTPVRHPSPTQTSTPFIKQFSGVGVEVVDDVGVGVILGIVLGVVLGVAVGIAVPLGTMEGTGVGVGVGAAVTVTVAVPDLVTPETVDSAVTVQVPGEAGAV